MDNKKLKNLQNLLFLDMFNMELTPSIAFQELPDNILGQVVISGMYTGYDIIDSGTTWPTDWYMNSYVTTQFAYNSSISGWTYSEGSSIDKDKYLSGISRHRMNILINNIYQNDLTLLRKIIQHELIHVYCIMKYSYYGHNDKFQELQEKFGVYSYDENGNKDYQYFHIN